MVTLTVSRGARIVALGVLIGAVAACGLPRSGPNKREIYAGSVLKNGDAFIVQVDARVTRATAVTPALGFSAAFKNAGVLPSDRVSIGDKLSLIVYENVKDDPLLSNTGQRVSSLQSIQVDSQGYVFVPYAGRVKAAGLTIEDLRTAISKKLDSQTPDPQIVLQRAAGDGSTVTVTGAVGNQSVVPIEQPTRTLMGMIARAGGVSIKAPAALVRVTRGNLSEQIWLQDLYENPGLDIALRPGDKINVEQDTRSFVALGATGAQNRIPFETQTLSAIEALATVGGLATNLADPTGIFVLRNENAEIANSVLNRKDLVGQQRMVYVLDLTQPNGLFNARDFLIRDGDTVFVTEAPYVRWQKTLNALTGTANSAATLQNSGL